jgi:DNA-binding IclR family transcriptional regulator
VIASIVMKISNFWDRTSTQLWRIFVDYSDSLNNVIRQMAMIQSVQKAIKLLQNLDSHGEWLGVRELARRIGLTPPSTHNMLQTLREMSFVEYNAATRQYRLGMAAIRLGEGADPLNQIRWFARPYVEALASEFGGSVLVDTWMHDQALAVDWLQAKHPHPRTVIHNRGVLEHPIVLATGRVLLAYQPRDVQQRYAAREELSRLGPNSPLTAVEMFDLLDRIAVAGFAITKNVTNSGITAVGAPVFDANNQLIFAIGCSEPMSRSTDARLSAIQSRLLEITILMNKKLGGGLAANGSAA